jgi:hypothetical protein
MNLANAIAAKLQELHQKADSVSWVSGTLPAYLTEAGLHGLIASGKEAGPKPWEPFSYERLQCMAKLKAHTAICSR